MLRKLAPLGFVVESAVDQKEMRRRMLKRLQYRRRTQRLTLNRRCRMRELSVCLSIYMSVCLPPGACLCVCVCLPPDAYSNLNLNASFIHILEIARE